LDEKLYTKKYGIFGDTIANKKIRKIYKYVIMTNDT